MQQPRPGHELVQGALEALQESQRVTLAGKRRLKIGGRTPTRRGTGFGQQEAGAVGLRPRTIGRRVTRAGGEERGAIAAGADRPAALFAQQRRPALHAHLVAATAAALQVDLGERRWRGREPLQDRLRQVAHDTSTDASSSAGAVAQTGSLWPPLAHHPAPAKRVSDPIAAIPSSSSATRPSSRTGPT